MSEEIEKSEETFGNKVYKVGDTISLYSDGNSVYKSNTSLFAEGNQVLEVEVKSIKTASVVFD
jgi:hypothetical protein